MLINDTSNLTQETIDKLDQLGLRHINTGNRPLTEETALELIRMLEENPNFWEE